MPRSTKTWRLKAPLRRGFFVALSFVVAGCASHAPPPLAPLPTLAALPSQAPSPEAPVDAQDCRARSECTLKLSRTLLFVFDYADAGAPLVLRQGTHLRTPPEQADGPWPALSIELGAAENGRFVMGAQCFSQCRVPAEDVIDAYRQYLMGQPCVWQQGRCIGVSKTQ